MTEFIDEASHITKDLFSSEIVEEMRTKVNEFFESKNLGPKNRDLVLAELERQAIYEEVGSMRMQLRLKPGDKSVLERSRELGVRQLGVKRYINELSESISKDEGLGAYNVTDAYRDSLEVRDVVKGSAGANATLLEDEPIFTAFLSKLLPATDFHEWLANQDRA